MKQRLSRIALTILAVLFSVFNAFATIDYDYGKDYGIEDRSFGEITSSGYVIGGIICLLVAIFFGYCTFADVNGNKEKEGKGYFGCLFVLAIIAAIYSLMHGCS